MIFKKYFGDAFHTAERLNLFHYLNFLLNPFPHRKNYRKQTETRNCPGYGINKIQTPKLTYTRKNEVDPYESENTYTANGDKHGLKRVTETTEKSR